MNITVYSTKTCHFCVKLKEFLKKHKIEFKNIDVSEDKDAAQEMIEKSGQMGVPVIEIDKEIIIGFNEEKIKKKLKIK